jgi:hypothetical protein
LPATFATNSYTVSAVCNLNDIVLYARLLSLATATDFDWNNPWSCNFGKDDGVFPNYQTNAVVYHGATTYVDQWVIATWVINNGALTIYVNGTLVHTTSVPATAIGATHLGLLGQAKGNETGDSWRGHVGEITLYSRALNATERGQVEGYLTAKWMAPAGPAWTYDFTAMADGPMPATLHEFQGSLPGVIASGHFMCQVDWFFTRAYDTLAPDQDATTHLTAMEARFVTASGSLWIIFAGNVGMTVYDAIEIHPDGSWLMLYDGGGVGGSPNLPAFTIGTTYKIHVTYDEVTGAFEIFVNGVSRATGNYTDWKKTGNRSGFFVNGNLDTWLYKFYYGPQSAGVPP